MTKRDQPQPAEEPEFKIDKAVINEVWHFFCPSKTNGSTQPPANAVPAPLGSNVVLTSPMQEAKKKAYQEKRRRYSISNAINILNNPKAANDASAMSTHVADKSSVDLTAPRAKRARRSESKRSELSMLAEPSIYPRAPMVDRPEGAIRKSPRAKAPRVMPDFVVPTRPKTTPKLTPRKRRRNYRLNAAIIPDLMERPVFLSAIQSAELAPEAPLAVDVGEAPEPAAVMPIRRAEPASTPGRKRRKSFPRSNYKLKRFSIPCPNAPIASGLMESPTAPAIIEEPTDPVPEAPLAVVAEEVQEPAEQPAPPPEPLMAVNHVPVNDDQAAVTEQFNEVPPPTAAPEMAASVLVPNGDDELQIAMSAHVVRLSNARHQLRVQCHQLDRTHYQLNVELF